MVLSNLELYARITAHELDLIGSQLSFSDRLARENDWSLEFTAQAIIEYKKFCYLAMTAPHEVTPSDEVDQVWHLHLLFTRDYWGTFCPDVLKKPLHHGPTSGGANERQRYLENYRETLKSYQREFDTKPPVALWPDEKNRFDETAFFQRINTNHMWSVPIPPILRHAKAVPLLLTSALLAIGGLVAIKSPQQELIAAASTSGFAQAGLVSFITDNWVTVFGAVGFGVFIWLLIKLGSSNKKSNGGCGGGTGGDGGCSGGAGCGGGGE